MTLLSDDVIDEVTVGYAGDYVLSQLLQWVQKRGLPDIYGCVMLPPIKGCWEEIKCGEVKLPNYSNHSYSKSILYENERWNRNTTTEYHAMTRPKLAKWFDDRYQRGSPWDQEVAKYFCPSDQTAPDPTMPMGSPVLDYLVTGIDANIRHVSASLNGNSSTAERGGSKMSASDRLQVTVDEGMPAQVVANWVQYILCKDNIWNPTSQLCDVPEDEWDMGDAPIKFDSHEELEIGVWFDVQREGKNGYHEAQVIELDLESNIRRAKFHFWKLSSDRDEWVEIGSPRIAPHHSYTPRPLDGYGAKSKKSFDANKVSLDQSLSSTASALPQKRKIDVVDVAIPVPSASAAGGDQNKFALFSKSTVDYLKAWMSQNVDNLFPSTSQKARIVADTGLNRRQVGDWMARQGRS
ncbi:hypothetical protein ACHAW5_007687 [Stephanodiscus triporus]|uniref:KN homeodomain domain-containing protein n=1 Tax=Stephanodiscus triporus TaxID=2934178 RepID=A0ABD3Q5H6_9STRA